MKEKDRESEDAWFRENEQDLLAAARQAREQREAERTAKESADKLRSLKELHFMKCPKCGHDMKTESHAGVQIDRCTFCEGVYLDAGELEQVYRTREQERRGMLRKLIGI